MPIDIARTAGAGIRLTRSVVFGSSLVFAGLGPVLSAAQVPVDLASAGSYAVLAGTAVTNTGNSVLDGDLGVHPGTEVTGFPPGAVNGQRHIGDAAAQRAQTDLRTAYDEASRRTPTRTTGPELGGQTFTPGIYRVPEAASLDGTVTLDAQGDAGAVFVFQLESALSTRDNSRVTVVNSPGPACNIAWTVGDSATLAAGTAFVGRLMAVNAVTMLSAARIEQGAALSRDGTVALDNNLISRCVPAAAPPVTPSSPTPSPSPTTITPSPSRTTPTPSPTTTTPSPSRTTPTPSPSRTTPSPSPTTITPSPSSPTPSPSRTTPTPSPTTTTPSPSRPATGTRPPTGPAATTTAT